jgi:hypothetical protein
MRALTIRAEIGASRAVRRVVELNKEEVELHGGDHGTHAGVGNDALRSA